LHFGDGYLRHEILRKIEELEISDRYFLMGHKDDVEDFYSIMDVFLMTSKMEGLGSSVMDAFNNNVGVVSTNGGGLKDLVYGRGVLCNVGDVDCLVDGIYFYLAGSKESIELKVKAKLYAEDNLQITSMVDNYVNFYKEILS